MGEGHWGERELEFGFGEDLGGEAERAADDEGEVGAFEIFVFLDELGELVRGLGFAVFVEGD